MASPLWVEHLSAYEMANGFTKRLRAYQKMIPVDDELHNAHEDHIAKQKSTSIIRSNNYNADKFSGVNSLKFSLMMENVHAPKNVISTDSDA